MPPRITFSKRPCSENDNIFIVCKDCYPALELYEVTGNPSYIHSFKKKRESKPLSKNGNYRLILVNDSDDPETSWRLKFKIEMRLGRQKPILLKMDESGKGQVFTQRNFHFQIVND